MRAGGVMIAVPSFGTLDVEFVARLYGLGLPVNADVTRAYPCGMLVADARNRAVAGAIERECEYVFFLDYDVLPPADALTRLIARDTPMVGGLYFTKAKPPWPLVLTGGHSTMDWTPGDLVQVDATGMGCMLLRVDLLEKLEPPWFDTGASLTDEGREWHTEDTYFFKRVREELGLSPYVDTGISCVHKDLLTGDRFFLGEDGLKQARALAFQPDELGKIDWIFTLGDLTATDAEVSQVEVEWIRSLRSNDPAVGYNRWPKHQTTG